MTSLSLPVLVLLVAVCNASHYRGGTFSWEPTEDGKVDITWRVSWMRTYYELRYECSETKKTIEAEGWLLCMECNQPDIYGKVLDLNCTDWNELENWSTGVGTFRYTPEPGMRQFTLSFQRSNTPNQFTFSSLWVTLENYGRDRNTYRMVTTVDLDVSNKSPKTMHPAMITLIKECGDVSIQIPVTDADGDDVKCRWTTQENECPKKACMTDGTGCSTNSVCGVPFKGATIDEDQCNYTFPVSKMKQGWYAVPITLEDHRSGVNGRLESGALSKVPLQFLIKVKSKGECRPITFVDLERCHVIHPEKDWKYTVKATSSANIEIIVVERPNEDFSMTPLKSHGSYSSRVVSWTPKVCDIGKHFALFHAVDSDGFYSSYETLTIHVLPYEEAPTIISSQSSPSPGTEISPKQKKWKIKFDKAIVRPDTSAYITISDLKGNVAAKYDVSNEQEVTINKNNPDVMVFDNPYDQLKPGISYLLIVDQGTAASTGCTNACGERCVLTNEAAKWLITTPPVQEPTVQCGTSSLSVYIPRDFVKGIRGPEKIRFIDSWSRECYAQMYNSTHYKMTTGFDECGTIAEKLAPGKLIFKNIVRDVPTPIAQGQPVTRSHRKIKINVTCEVQGTNYYDVSFIPSDTVEEFTVHGKSRVKSMMKLYKDDTFEHEYRKEEIPMSVELNQRLFFGLEAVNKAKDIQIINCTATPREKSGCTPDNYMFIKNGCPIDSTVRVEQSFSQYRYVKKKFSMEAFSFLFSGSTEEVLVKCKTAICNPGDLNSICRQMAMTTSCPSKGILVPSNLDVMEDVVVPILRR